MQQAGVALVLVGVAFLSAPLAARLGPFGWMGLGLVLVVVGAGLFVAPDGAGRGRSETRTCPACGAPNASDTDDCEYCGEPL